MGNWELMLGMAPLILEGLGITLGVSLIALSTGILLGLLLGLGRVYGGRPLARLATLYSTVVRAIPTVVALLLLYFVIARLVNLSPFWAGAVALGLVSGSYQSEIVRGSIEAVAVGQMVAARAIGMTRLQAIRHIILPQALRIALPPWSNEAAIVLKDSSLVYVLGVPEMLRRAQYISARTYRPFLAFTTVALIYLVLTLVTNRGLGSLERRLKIPALETG